MLKAFPVMCYLQCSFKGIRVLYLYYFFLLYPRINDSYYKIIITKRCVGSSAGLPASCFYSEFLL